VGLGGVLWAVWRVLDLLAPDRYTISELSSEWEASGAIRGEGVRKRRLRRKYPVADWFARNPEHLANHDSPTQLLEHWRDRSAVDRDRVLIAINDMLLAANFRRSRATFESTKAPLACAMFLAATGIGVFAWAANPGDQGFPSARNSNLTGADLSGASLKGVDFTGANFSGANLRGAVLTHAIIDKVTWKNTTCPDGTNSDDTAGTKGTGSCVGHLSP
jgi:Pentapeptide repeats (8 copies)